MKKSLIFISLLLVSLVNFAQEYEYSYEPEIGEYTQCSNIPYITSKINYASCYNMAGTTSYDCSVVRAALWSRSSSGRLTFRIKRCDNGYFMNGTSGKIVIRDGWNGDLECIPYSITNSTTSYLSASIYVNDWIGDRTFNIFLLTSTNNKYHAGSIHAYGNYEVFDLEVTQPTSSDVFEEGDICPIRWTTNVPANANDANISLYQSGSWVMDIANNTANDGSYNWTVPALGAGSDYRIRVETNYAADLSEPFSIEASTCSGTTFLTSSSGSFDDGSGNYSDYGNHSNCYWLIQPVGASSITLSFSSFHTESCCDFVDIYDNSSATGTPLQRYSGNISPDPVTSNTGIMLVHFSSDGSVTYDGWSASYTSSNAPVGCSWTDCNSGSCGSTQYLTVSQKYTAAQYLCQHNIIDGSGTTSLNPDGNITRAELAKIALYGLYDGELNVPENLVSDYFPSPYPDLQNRSTYYYRAAKALMYLQYNNDANGITPFDRDLACFNPNGTVSRRIMLKVLMETFNIAPYNGSSTYTPFSDFSSTDNLWRYAKRAYDLGITNVSNFRPNDNCTRAEAFEFLYRILTSANISIPTPVNTCSSSTSDFFIPNNLSPEALSAIGGIEYGNYKYYNKNCFTNPGWVSMDFGFNYNSYLTEMPTEYYPLTPLGSQAWNHTYSTYINIIHDDYSGLDYILLHLNNGSLYVYEKNGNTIRKKTEGNYNEIAYNGSDTYTITTPSQDVYTFVKLSNNAPIYYLTTIRNRFGDGIDINYVACVTATGKRRISTVTSGSGTGARTLTFSYHTGTDKLKEVKDSGNRTVQFSYSGDNLHQFTDAKNQTTTYNYGTYETETGLLKSVILPEGNTVYNDYAQRKLTSTRTNSNIPTTISQNVSQSNNTTTYSSTITEPARQNSSENITTHYVMNSLGKIVHISDGCNVDKTINYNHSSHPTLPSSIVDNKTGITTSYSYSSAGLVTNRNTSASGLSLSEQWQYRSDNLLERYTDANNHTTTYAYSSSGAISGITDALNHTTTITCNSHGYPTAVQTSNGISTNYSYTTRGLTSQVSISGTGLSQSNTYDVFGRLTNVTDFNGNTTYYTFDANDNITDITDANNNTTSYSYDANDNLTRITNALGRITTMTYDENDLCTSQSFGGHTKNFTYNTDGALKTFTNPNGQTLSYTYNLSGEITNDGYASYNYLNNSLLGSVTKDAKAIAYEYDVLGRVISITYDGETVRYTYDNVGNLITITYPGNKTVTYTYDAANRMTSVKDWNNHTTTYSYNNDNQLVYVQYPNNVRTTYSYDNAGRRIGQVARRDSGNGTIIAQYTYTLDNNGNHTAEYATEPYTSLPDNIVNQHIDYYYDNFNRLTSAGNTTFNYDNNGNTTSKTGRNYTYDIGDNITSISGNLSNSYTYDGLGNRRSATRNGVTTKYVLDILTKNANVLMETNSNGTVQNYYIYGADGLISRIGADASTTHYYVFDHRGSTIAMVNSSTAATITHKYQYDEFGNVLQSDEADCNLFRYVGKYGLIQETEDLYFVRARYYDPSIGRFLSEDPVWSSNLYPYANNNPITNIDPSGTIFTEIAISIALISIGTALIGEAMDLQIKMDNVQYQQSKIETAMESVDLAHIPAIVYNTNPVAETIYNTASSVVGTYSNIRKFTAITQNSKEARNAYHTNKKEFKQSHQKISYSTMVTEGVGAGNVAYGSIGKSVTTWVPKYSIPSVITNPNSSQLRMSIPWNIW